MDLRETPRRPFQRHPWETARLRFFRQVLERHGLIRQSLRILDVGAGDAWFSARLLRYLPGTASITCWDSGYGATPPAAEPGLTFCREAPEGQFQLALLLDVLEHVEDDADFLGSVRDRIEPGGGILVSVPAWSRLFSAHDRALLHYRRYDPVDALRLLQQAGLEIRESGGLFHGLLAARFLGLMWERFRRPTGAVTPSLEWRMGKRLAKLVEGALAADNALSTAAARRRLALPGLSWWALCRRH